VLIVLGVWIEKNVNKRKEYLGVSRIGEEKTGRLSP